MDNAYLIRARGDSAVDYFFMEKLCISLCFDFYIFF